MYNEIERYKGLLNDIKVRLRSAQQKASLSVNAELITMYRDIGQMINQQQKAHGWGAGIIRKLSSDLKNELPEEKGFSERNLKFMAQFYKEYFDADAIGKQLVSQIPWGHNIILMQKIKSKEARFKYMQQIIESGWSRDILVKMIQGSWHNRQGVLTRNFKSTLPDLQSHLAQQMLKDPYIFDFLTTTEPFNERELETELIKHLERFLIELGSGFAFVGRQYHLQKSDKDFYIDLLFYHLKLRAYIVIELKKGEFKPKYVGKLNFYCSAVDDILKHETDRSTIDFFCKTEKYKRTLKIA